MAPPKDSDLVKALKKESLRYASDNTQGYFRQKLRGNFKYYDTKGKKITDEKVIARINSLAIPPAWKKVWISPAANGHIQATGIDDKKRKQYIYHEDWKKISQENKFSKIIDFGLSLPKIRSSVKYNLSQKDLSRKKIISTIVWLLENTLIRIGNEEYSKENDSFGLTTLRNRHVKIKGGEAIFNFIGKSGIENTLSIKNPTVLKTIKKCAELPGYGLFQYIDDKGNKRVVDSEDVNLFLKDVTGDDFSAKDFRTWGASNLSSNIFYKLGNATDTKALKKNVTDTVKKVAEHLNNTVSICKNYYIHPTVIRTYESEILVPHFGKHFGKKSNISGLSWNESALVKLLKKH